MTTTHLPDALREELQRLENELALDPRYAKIARIRALLETYEADPTPAPKEAQHRPRPPVFWKSEEDVVIAPLVQKRKHSDDDIQALLPRLPGRNTSQVDARIRRLRIKKKGETAKAIKAQQRPAEPSETIEVAEQRYLEERERLARGSAEATRSLPEPKLLPPGDRLSPVPDCGKAEPPENLAELEQRYTTDPLYERRQSPSGDMEPYLIGGIEALTLRPRR